MKILHTPQDIQTEITLLVDRKFTYIFEISSPPLPDVNTSETLSFYLDNAPLEFTPKKDALIAQTTLTEGIHHVHFQLKNPGNLNLGDLSFLAYPDISRGLSISLNHYDTLQPFADARITTDTTRQALILKTNASVSYPFYIPQEGDYTFEIEGKHDQPGPVVWEVWFDSAPHSVIPFSKGDRSIATQKTTAHLAKGLHTISLFFVSDYTSKKQSSDNDTDGILYSISVSPATEAAAPFLKCLPIPLTAPVKTVSNPSQWQLLPEDMKWTMKDSQEPTITLTVPYDFESFALVPPTLILNPSDVLLASFEIKTEHLRNHKVNIELHYFNDEGEKLEKRFIFKSEFYGTTDWVPCVVFTPGYRDVSQVLLAPCIYQQSRRRYSDDATVSIRNFRIHLPY